MSVRGIKCISRDFEHAKKACDLGAFIFWKPIEDGKLHTYDRVSKSVKTGSEMRKSMTAGRLEKGRRWIFAGCRAKIWRPEPAAGRKVDEVFHTLQDVMKEGLVYYSICRS